MTSAKELARLRVQFSAWHAPGQPALTATRRGAGDRLRTINALDGATMAATLQQVTYTQQGPRTKPLVS